MRDKGSGTRPPAMLSVRQVGRELGIKQRQVHAHLRAGTWPGAVQLGPRSWRVPATAVQRSARASLAG